MTSLLLSVPSDDDLDETPRAMRVWQVVAALRDMGSSSITVRSTSSSIAAVATYESAGFRPLPHDPDLRRPA